MVRKKLSPVARAKYEQVRNRRHMHNGFFGSVRMAMVNLETIFRSPTTTLRAKQIAADGLLMLQMLAHELETRID